MVGRERKSMAPKWKRFREKMKAAFPSYYDEAGQDAFTKLVERAIEVRDAGGCRRVHHGHHRCLCDSADAEAAEGPASNGEPTGDPAAADHLVRCRSAAYRPLGRSRVPRIEGAQVGASSPCRGSAPSHESKTKPTPIVSGNCALDLSSPLGSGNRGGVHRRRGVLVWRHEVRRSPARACQVWRSPAGRGSDTGSARATAAAPCSATDYSGADRQRDRGARRRCAAAGRREIRWATVAASHAEVRRSREEVRRSSA